MFRRALDAVCLLLLATAGAPTVYAQDVLALDVASAAAGDAITIPIRLRDRVGTGLDGAGDPHRSIRGVALTVVPRPAEAVEALDFLRSGVTQGLAPRFEIVTGEPSQRSWILSFDQSIDVGPGSVEIGEIQLRLAAGIAPGTSIDLELVPATSALSNADGTVLETVASGGLALLNGRIDVVAAGCTTTTTLCLLDDRFRVEVSWRDFGGNDGAGRPARLADDSGSFWFFDPANVELVVKVLDGRAINGNFWVFYGALSNVEFEIEIIDTATGASKSLFNPSGEFASVGDTSAFVGSGSLSVSRTAVGQRGGVGSSEPISVIGANRTCLSDDTHLCSLDRRFRLSVDWTDFAGNSGSGRARRLTDETGYFWFFGPNNIELVVKTLDARHLNGSFWVFYGALTNVEFTLEVLDTVTGIKREYQNPSGVFASFGDTSAFPVP